MFAIKDAFSAMTTWKKAIIIGTPVVLVGGFVYSKYTRNRDKKYSDMIDEDIINVDNEHIPADIEIAEKILNHLDVKAAGNKNFRNSNYQRAIECYSEAIRICPEDQLKDRANCYQNRAAAYEQLGDIANVLSDCNKAIEDDVKYVKAYRRRASAYESQSMFIEALNDRTTQCILEDYKIPATMDKANDVLKLASMQKAKECFKTKEPAMPSIQFVSNYLSSYFNDPIIPTELSGAVVDSSIQSVQINEAILSNNYDVILDLVDEEMETINTEEDGEPMTLKHQYLILVKATFLMLIGDFPKCLETFAKLIDVETTDPKYTSNALIKRASIHLLQDNREMAFEDIKNAILVYPENEDTYYHRAQLHLIMDNMDEAILDYAKVVEMSPNFAIARAQHCFALSRNAFQKRDYGLLEKSNEEFEKIVKKFSSVAQIHSLYAQSLMDQQKFQSAHDEFKASININKNDIGTICQLALLIMQWKRDEDLTIKMLKEAVPLDVRSKMPLEILGTLAVQNGNTGEALEYFYKALEIITKEDDLIQMYSLILATEAQALSALIKSK